MVVFFYGAYRHYDGGMLISFMWLSKSLSFESWWHHIWTFQMNFTMATMIDLFGKKYISMKLATREPSHRKGMTIVLFFQSLTLPVKKLNR